jgi:hypothetical protein
VKLPKSKQRSGGFRLSFSGMLELMILKGAISILTTIALTICTVIFIIAKERGL